jgi:thioredoxin reductase (NADPH)
MVAIGRDGRPESYSADKAGLKIQSGKIIGREIEPERTNIDHIYAIGDVVLGVPELMPVAQKSGRLLAKRVHLRLSKNEPSGAKITEEEILKQYSTDYKLIPTTVFSPTEYSFIGLSEEEAQKTYGSEAIDVYHRETTPL